MGPKRHQARAVLGGRYHLERAAGARAAGLAGERQRAGRHDARRHASRPAAAGVVPGCDRVPACSSSTPSSRSRRATTPSSARSSTALFRELHSIKGEASALNLTSVATACTRSRTWSASCKKKPQLSGNDFLPLVLKLDELLAHLRSVRELAARLSALRDAAAAARRRRATRRAAAADAPRADDSARRCARSPSGWRTITRRASSSTLDGSCGGSGALHRDREGRAHPDAAQLRGAWHRGRRTSAAPHGKDEVGAVRVEFTQVRAKASSSYSRTTAPGCAPSS